jgi:hypothetical protein
VWDTVAMADTAKLCTEVRSHGGIYGAILEVKFSREDMKTTWSLGYTATGERVENSTVSLSTQPDHFEFMGG